MYSIEENSCLQDILAVVISEIEIQRQAKKRTAMEESVCKGEGWGWSNRQRKLIKGKMRDIIWWRSWITQEA